MGRRPIAGDEAGTFVGVTLPPDLLAALDKHARKIAKRDKAAKPSRTKAIRELLSDALGVGEFG